MYSYTFWAVYSNSRLVTTLKVGFSIFTPGHRCCRCYCFNLPFKSVYKLQGTWRKLYVDDLMPFNDDEKPLLPMTALGHELWPLLLSKALIKVASLE